MAITLFKRKYVAEVTQSHWIKEEVFIPQVGKKSLTVYLEQV